MNGHRLHVLFGAIGLLTFFVTAIPGSGGTAPKITCKEPECRFGRMDDSQVIDHTFVIGNGGDAVLEIGKIRGCCGATTELATNRIPAGSNTTFKVKFSLRGRKGEQRKSIYLGSNDPKQLYLQLRFVGTVTSGTDSSPEPAEVVQTFSETQQTSNIPPVVIDYFYEAGCPDCNRVRKEILPKLNERFEGYYVVNRHDIGIKTNVFWLMAYEDKLSIKDNRPVCMVVDYQYVFNGFAAIKKGLLSQMDTCVTARLDPNWKPPEPIAVKISNGPDVAEERVRRFTLSAVITAGLIDGINPCAISTLVFFMSLLGVSRVKGGGLLMMGVAFCLASFVTYTAIGFGLIRTLYLFEGLPMVRFGMEAVMMGLLAVFAYLSFRDAWRFHQSGNPHDISLQLPDRIKAEIHGIMRKGLATGSLVLGGLLMGATVTVLESICTGQVYVPTLVLVIKSRFGGLTAGGESASRAWSYLFLYNAMFIVPLALVFVLTFLGLRTQTLLEWSKRNVVASKILLGVFFLAMAVLIAVL